MDKKFRELKPRDGICAAAVILGLIGAFFFPQTGEAVLWDEASFLLAEIGLGMWLLCLTIAMRKREKKRVIIGIGLTTAVVLVVAGLSAFQIIADSITGPREYRLRNCSVETNVSLFGIIGMDHYLVGYDDLGEKHRFVISADDYDLLSNQHYITLLGYDHTDRIVSYQGKGRAFYE